MIVLTVLSYNGAPADGPSAQFDELGGTIGRADNNQLVLPDPERTISRVHARVVFRAGRYAIVDNGSNPISVNNTPVGAGREQPLQPGDQLQIGGYVLQASQAASAAATADPFADLFGDAPVGLAAAPARAAPAAASSWPSAAAPAPAAAWPSPTPAPAATLKPGVIPDDWDPFAPDPVTPQPTAPSDGAGQSLLGVSLARADSLDDLFGLSVAPAGADPLGATPAQAAGVQPNTAAHDDPLQSLSKPAATSAASLPDHFSELNTPMPLIPPPVAPSPVPAAPVAALPTGAVFSWDAPPSDGRIVTLPDVRRQADVPPPAVARAPESAPAPVPSPPRPGPAPVTTDPGTHGELLEALLSGLGAPHLRLDALTPETMHLIGQLLRESMRGAVELLVARAALKREMRAEMTMIVARENNPLKFSPTVEAALQHLLGPQTPGFMAPAPAVRDAFDDLRAHQMGVMAGMRAALEGVLKRFDPQQLEGKLTHRSAISTLIPSTRKAKLWESFQELFAQLQTEAQDDFDELFGRAFLRAYEDQLDRLHGESGPH